MLVRGSGRRNDNRAVSLGYGQDCGPWGPPVKACYFRVSSLSVMEQVRL